MNYHADSITFQGASHTKCDDYSLTFDLPNGGRGLIVCDGCSSSHMSDIGSRIMACLAKDTIRRWHHIITNKYRNVVDFEQTLNTLLLNSAVTVIKTLGLDTSVLASTLMVCFPIKGGKHEIIVYGDGVVFFRNRKTQELHFKQINFKSNAPYYQIYDLDPTGTYVDFLQQQMRSTNPKEEKTIIDEQGTVSVVPLTSPYVLDLDDSEVDLIGIATDGVESFTDSITIIPTADVLKEFVSIKGTYGEFVKRRVNKATKMYAKQGFAPYDDVSVAIMYIEEEV